MKNIKEQLMNEVTEFLKRKQNESYKLKLNKSNKAQLKTSTIDYFKQNTKYQGLKSRLRKYNIHIVIMKNKRKNESKIQNLWSNIRRPNL
jgi:ferric iron reductase protein FhuF